MQAILPVNGIPANNFILSNGNMTITFDFTTSPAGQGVNTMHIAAGAFNCTRAGARIHLQDSLNFSEAS